MFVSFPWHTSSSNSKTSISKVLFPSRPFPIILSPFRIRLCFQHKNKMTFSMSRRELIMWCEILLLALRQYFLYLVLKWCIVSLFEVWQNTATGQRLTLLTFNSKVTQHTDIKDDDRPFGKHQVLHNCLDFQKTGNDILPVTCWGYICSTSTLFKLIDFLALS